MPPKQFKTDPEVEGQEFPDLSTIQPVPGNTTSQGNDTTPGKFIPVRIIIYVHVQADILGLDQNNSKDTLKHLPPNLPCIITHQSQFFHAIPLQPLIWSMYRQAARPV